jgi:xylulokinase
MKQTGTKFDQIIAIGGGSRSIYWLKTIATVLGMCIDLPKEGCDLGAAFGAARIGIMAAEKGKKLNEVFKTPEISTTFEPEAKFTNDYERKYKIFQQLYPAIKAITQ